jgi:hypothetical protein
MDQADTVCRYCAYDFPDPPVRNRLENLVHSRLAGIALVISTILSTLGIILGLIVCRVSLIERQ